MLFSDLNFIFRVLPLFLLIYYILPYKFRSLMVVISGIVFYVFCAGAYVIVPGAAIIINHLLSPAVAERRKGAYILSITVNVAVLAVFKISAYASAQIPLPHIISGYAQFTGAMGDTGAVGSGLFGSFGNGFFGGGLVGSGLFGSFGNGFFGGSLVGSGLFGSGLFGGGSSPEPAVSGMLSIALPLGISFFTFKLLSYQADLYNGRIKHAGLTDLAAYVIMFPTIVSGPITRFDYVLDNPNRILGSSETTKSRLRNAFEHIEEGLLYFIPGLFLKIVIADHMAILWKEIGTIGYDSISTPLAWLGVVVFSMNLYFDFWGYSLMAAGLAVMLGYSFIRNFNNPYAAASVTDFYRRWHVTLGEWFRDYVYIPLGGSRCSKGRIALNLCVVWLLTGLWHGLSVNYLIWAGVLLALILWEKFVLSPHETLYRILGRLHVLVIIPVTWIIFAIPSWKDLSTYLMRLAGLNAGAGVINSRDAATLLSEGYLYIILAFVFLLPGWRRVFKQNRYRAWMTVALVAVFWLSIYSISGAVTNPFMYMSF